MGSAWFFLAVQVVNPSHCFDIADFPQLTLCNCKVRIPADYDFNRHSGPAGIGRRMSPGDNRSRFWQLWILSCFTSFW
jgi:hypothetical protein